MLVGQSWGGAVACLMLADCDYTGPVLLTAPAISNLLTRDSRFGFATRLPVCRLGLNWRLQSTAAPTCMPPCMSPCACSPRCPHLEPIASQPDYPRERLVVLGGSRDHVLLLHIQSEIIVIPTTMKDVTGILRILADQLQLRECGRGTHLHFHSKAIQP